MKEIFEKIVERLEEQRGHICNCMSCNGCKYIGDCNEGEFAEDVALDRAVEIVNQVAEEYKSNDDLISRSGLLECFKKNGVEITFDLPVEELLGKDVDIDDFTMLVQDAIQAYRKMVIDTIKNQPIVSNEEVCEWVEKSVDSIKLVREPHRLRLFHIEEDRQYCPYCGKKIKVV